MVKNALLILLLVFGTERAFSQSDTLNQLDSNGKKTGWWITYLDSNLKVLKDSAGATRCMYNYYTGIYFHYRYGDGLGSKKYPVHFPQNESLKLGTFELLDGEYITKHKNGNLRSVLSASEGILIEYKEYYRGAQLKLEFIYSPECGAPQRHCIRQYKKNGEMKFDGWNMVPRKTESNIIIIPENSDSSMAQTGSLDGNSYLIKVTQASGEKSQWPADTLKFDSGKMVSIYMEGRERFYPSSYSHLSSKIASDSLIGFDYENNNLGGSSLRITGAVKGEIIEGTITWTSLKGIRTYSFKGTLQ